MAAMTDPPKKILVIFKTHLDLGYTDLAKNILERYLTEYIPSALKVARESRGTQFRFRWTIGSWMLEQYRQHTGGGAALEEAVARGDIRWHALPFTTHTEYMSPGLLDYGLSISRRLDRRYGMRTIGAKLTDVPGHTVAMVPHLARAGVKFLHIGVNPASTVPRVPPLFGWRAPGGEQVLVMYNGDYGEMTPVGNGGVSLYFAHTGDNRGPQSMEEVRKIYEALRARYPDAVLEAGTLEDAAAEALAQEGLPVVTDEIGDSWIHGTGADPAKTSACRAMLRQGEAMPEPERSRLYDALLPIPEHTWGLDEKTHLTGSYPEDHRLGEHRFFTRREFEDARKTPPFQRMEASWREQREYLEKAARSIGVKVPETCRRPAGLTGWRMLESRSNIRIGGFTVDIGPDGALRGLTRNGRVWADEAHPLGGFRYEVFSQAEYDRFRRQYVTNGEEWAVEDFGKIGVEAANEHYRAYVPELTEAYRKDGALLLRSAFPREARERFGAPYQLETAFRMEEDRVLIDAAWFGKPASRIPEGLWMEFSPMARLESIHKIDAWLDPFRVVSGGNRRMHVTQEGVAWAGLRLKGLDTGLVSLGGPALLRFEDTLPEPEGGAWFCLYNNVWGTNFPMWYGEDARFRFELTFTK